MQNELLVLLDEAKNEVSEDLQDFLAGLAGRTLAQFFICSWQARCALHVVAKNLPADLVSLIHDN